MCTGVALFRGDRVKEVCSVLGAAGREAGGCLCFQCKHTSMYSAAFPESMGAFLPCREKFLFLP